MKIKKHLIVLLFFAAVSSALAQSRADTVISKKLNWMFYPYAFYTPETNLAFGAGGLIYLRLDTSKAVLTSKIKVSAYYTLSNLYSFSLTPSIFFPGVERANLEAELSYAKIISKFYGLGGDTPDTGNPYYSLNKFRVYLEVASRSILFSSFNSGLVFEYADNIVYDTEENNYLQDTTLLGRTGGKLLGLGLLGLVDLRDNVFYPTKNGYYKFSLTFYHSFMGSDFNYANFIVDLRQYKSFSEGHVLAAQLYAHLTRGGPPFFNLPALGGEKRMRGYFEGRYRDRQYITAQIEYRKLVWWRLGFVAFFSVGDVAGHFSDFKFKRLKTSYGFGLRFLFDQEEHINIRMDVGFGHKTNGVYFGLEEAF